MIPMSEVHGIPGGLLFNAGLAQAAKTSKAGLRSLSSIALLMLGSAQSLQIKLESRISGTLLATMLFMQAIGPLATKISIIGFGEAHGAKAGAAGTRRFG